MKHVLKSLTAASITRTLIFSLTGCGSKKVPKKEIDYDRMIESFVPDSFNTKSLAVGEVDGPQARIWLESGMGTVYTSNDKVVTISDLGKVTAVGTGSAYVVITGMGGMFEVYRYDVY